MFANANGVGRVKTSKYKAWREEAGWMLRAARPKGVHGRVRVELTVSNEYGGDLDNCIKAVLDVLQAVGIVVNDRQVKVLFAQYGAVAGMRVAVEPI